MAPRRTVAPQLADISQDIAGEIPVSVVLGWATGAKTAKRHRQMLTPYIVRATVVSSDSAGLSKLARQKSLLEVMKLVHDPKEIIYQYGTAVGGKAVGVWAADNTQMLYPEEIAVADVVGQMVSAQQELQSLTVKIGLGIHQGEFIHIGGGLFGKDADLVEHIAETHTEGGDILVTPIVHKHISSIMQKSAEKLDIAELKLTAYNLRHANHQGKKIKSDHAAYPFPFSQDFFELLTNMHTLEKNEIQKVFSRYAKEHVVVLIKIRHSSHPFLLDQFAHWILANAAMLTDATQFGMERIKSNGSLGIFVGNQAQSAVEFAINLKRRLLDSGYEASVGITRGEVLVFSLGDGAKDIAGNPVNVASKLAEDVDTEGSIWIDSAALPEKHRLKGQPFDLTVSGVALSGTMIAD